MNGAAVFVFGSNREGRHGAGAALEAYRRHGARYGQPEGRQGAAYAIVTKELRRGRRPVNLEEIGAGVARFLAYAAARPGTVFQVTRIGCGLAGFTDAQIAPLFAGAGPNVQLPEGWRDAFTR